MADISRQPGGVKEDERDKQNELPSRATRSAIYEKNTTLGVGNG